MKGDVDSATQFISSLTKALQAVIHGSLDFSKHIEVGGYLYVRVDNAERVDYVLSEKLQKSDVNSMTFLSNSFHAVPPEDGQQKRSSKERNIHSAHISVEPTGRSTSAKPQSRSFETGLNLPHSSSLPPQHTLRRNSDHFHKPQADADRDNLKTAQDSSKWPVSAGNSSAQNTFEASRSSNTRTQSLTDFQTAFRSPPPAFMNQSQQSSTSSHMSNFPQNQNGSSSKSSCSNMSHHQQQQQQSKAGILPEPSEMEVVHIKTEDEDDVFNIPLQCQQGGSETGPDSKPTILHSPSDSQLPVSFPNIFHPPLPPSTSAGGAHLGWLDAALPSLPTQPDPHQQDSFQTMMAPQSSASFVSVPCQSLAQSSPRWPKPPGSSSLHGRFSRVNCRMCGHVSMSQQAHVRHMTIRHGSRGDFACGECGKVFQTKLYLNQHMKSHGERKFACEVCGQRFLYKHHLPRHQLAVHGAVTYNSANGGGGQPPLPPPTSAAAAAAAATAAAAFPPADPLEGLPVVFENPS